MSQEKIGEGEEIANEICRWLPVLVFPVLFFLFLFFPLFLFFFLLGWFLSL